LDGWLAQPVSNSKASKGKNQRTDVLSLFMVGKAGTDGQG